MRKLYLSKTDVKIFGVCGGIAESYDLDPTLVRLAVVFAAIVTGGIPLVVTYIIARLIIPFKPGEQ